MISYTIGNVILREKQKMRRQFLLEYTVALQKQESEERGHVTWNIKMNWTV